LEIDIALAPWIQPFMNALCNAYLLKQLSKEEIYGYLDSRLPMIIDTVSHFIEHHDPDDMDRPVN
jgi:hypothetical protein